MKISLLALLFAISACQNPPDRLTKKQYFIFGTIVEVLVWHNDKQLVDKALSDVETELNGMHSQWHAWKPGRLHEVNKALRNAQSFILTEEEARFIKLTAELSDKSLGNFNPAIGQLINLWGFHSDDYPITEPPPDKSDVLKYLEKMPVMTDITIENNQITSKNQQIWLDFGVVAKGYAIDKAINILKKHGVVNAIVNAGGDLRSIGSKGDKNWQVAIRKPNSEDVIAVISVQGDESIFTSGNYERYKEFDGKRYAHIINPKTGYGVEEIVSATVITDNGTKADAAATALIVAGTKDWHKVAQSMELDQVLLLKADGLCVATEKMM
jgi:thiamine biosynthesis lipoprotein